MVPEDLWGRIEPLLPVRQRRPCHPGRLPLDDRGCLQGIVFVLHTGIQWEWLPQELGFGSGMTCWRRLRDRHEAGAWDRLLGAADRAARCREAGLVPGASRTTKASRMARCRAERTLRWGPLGVVQRDQVQPAASELLTVAADLPARVHRAEAVPGQGLVLSEDTGVHGLGPNGCGTVADLHRHPQGQMGGQGRGQPSGRAWPCPRCGRRPADAAPGRRTSQPA